MSDSATALLPRVGLGWDIHRLVPGRALVLGGVAVEFNKGLLGHSDGDVVLHAVIDALLGAAGLDDIGQLFPDTDPGYKDMDSRKLVGLALAAVAKAGFCPVQVDAVVVLQAPRLANLKEKLRASLAGLLGLDYSAANIKAKTAERLGEIGRGEAIACYAVAMLAPIDPPQPAQLV